MLVVTDIQTNHHQNEEAKTMAQLGDIQAGILNQLTESQNGYSRIVAMIGAHTFTYSGREGVEPDNIAFRFKMSRKANWCKITLNNNDLYDVEFCRFHGIKILNTYKFENVFAEDLHDIFEDVTGLCIKL